MKTALCLSGHLRNYQRSAKIIRESFDGDIFLSTWDVVDVDGGKNTQSIDEALEIFKPVNFSIEDFTKINILHKTKYEKISKYVKFNANFHKNRHGWDSYSMFYLMKKVGELVNKDYDLVMRFRPDFTFSGFNPETIENNCLYFPQNSNYINTTDNIFYGKQETMNFVFMCYDMMDLWLLREGANWINEQLLYHHINQFGIKIKSQPGFTYDKFDYVGKILL